MLYDILNLRDVAQFGSAPLWGSGGRGFKSRRSDNYYKIYFQLKFLET